MIGLDSYSRQVFIYLDTISIYISLRIDCLFEIRKIAVFPLAFIAGWLQGHWWGFISRNYVVQPTFLLMNVFIALKGSHFWFLFGNFSLFSGIPIGVFQSMFQVVALETFKLPADQNGMLMSYIGILTMVRYEPHREKTCICHMGTTKVQISLHICAVWSVPLIFAT